MIYLELSWRRIASHARAEAPLGTDPFCDDHRFGNMPSMWVQKLSSRSALAVSSGRQPSSIVGRLESSGTAFALALLGDGDPGALG